MRSRAGLRHTLGRGVRSDPARTNYESSQRLGLWSDAENTPFGHGRPYTRGQLEQLVREADFEPIARARRRGQRLVHEVHAPRSFERERASRGGDRERAHRARARHARGS